MATPMLIHGGIGNDTLIGGKAADAIYGESGVDSILGGGGNDKLLGDGNADAATVAREYGLYVVADEFLNYLGKNEKWLMTKVDSSSGDVKEYYITPDGRLYQYSSYVAGEYTVLDTLVGSFDPSFYQDVRKLESEGGLFEYGQYYGVGNRDEKWLRGIGNPQSDGWYFITPAGELYRWDGLNWGVDNQTPVTGTLVATLDPSYHVNPHDLVAAATHDAGADVLNGQGGDDALEGGAGNDTLKGVDGKDTLIGGNDSDVIYGGDDDDELIGCHFLNGVETGNPNDTIYGGNGNDGLYGGDGDDFMVGQNGNDFLKGDDGNDHLIGCFYGSGGETGGANDTIYGGDASDSLYGGDGTDFMVGEDGHDFLKGDNGIDTLIGCYFGWGVEPNGGNDTIYGGIGNDLLYGGDGEDFMVGEDGHDFLKGDDGSDTLIGCYFGWGVEPNGGNDTIYGGIGNDLIYGGDGRDKLYGENDNDFLRGDGGGDILEGNWGNDTLVGEAGVDFLSGGPDNDTLFGAGQFNNYNYQDSGNFLWGNDGNDNLYGGNGNDFMEGGLHNDGLFGGLGNNTLRGTDGADRYLVRPGETVDDLNPEDARVTFANGDRNWTDQEIYIVDTGLAFLHGITNNTRMLEMSPARGGGELTFQRVIRLGATTLGDNNGMGRIRITDWGFNSGFPMVENVVHEIGHNWDDSTERGGTAWNNWLGLSGWQPHNDGGGSLFPPDGFFLSLDGQWDYRANAQFHRNYGTNNPFDDLCTMWEAYFQWTTGTLSAANVNRLRAKLDFVDAFFASQRT
jgi:Ca2+-binding RTX toxin-like protein